MKPLISGKASAVRKSRIGSALSVSMWPSSCDLVGALPAATLSCLRRFCVDRMPLVKPAEITGWPLRITTSVVTAMGSVVPASPQKNSGIGSPLYLPGCAVGEGGTGCRPATGQADRRDLVFDLEAFRADLGGVAAAAQREIAPGEFLIGQTLVSCSSQSGLDWVLKAAQAGRMRRSISLPSSARWMRVIMKPRQSLISSSVRHAR